MKSKLIFLLILFSFGLLTLPGCITVNRHFSEIKNKLLGKLGEDYKTEYQFSVGPALIHISSWFVDMAADQEYIDDMIREISSVQVGIYNKLENGYRTPNYGTLKSIDQEMTGNGWKNIVRSVDKDELTAIYVGAEPDEVLQKMYVISLNDEELVIVEINGDLKKVISYALEEKDFHIKM